MEDGIVRFDRDFYASHTTDIPPEEYHELLTGEEMKHDLREKIFGTDSTPAPES